MPTCISDWGWSTVTDDEIRASTDPALDGYREAIALLREAHDLAFQFRDWDSVAHIQRQMEDLEDE